MHIFYSESTANLRTLSWQQYRVHIVAFDLLNTSWQGVKNLCKAWIKKKRGTAVVMIIRQRNWTRLKTHCDLFCAYLCYFFTFHVWTKGTDLATAWRLLCTGRSLLKVHHSERWPCCITHMQTHTHMLPFHPPTPTHTQHATVPAAMAPMSGWMVTAQG